MYIYIYIYKLYSYIIILFLYFSYIIILARCKKQSKKKFFSHGGYPPSTERPNRSPRQQMMRGFFSFPESMWQDISSEARSNPKVTDCGPEYGTYCSSGFGTSIDEGTGKYLLNFLEKLAKANLLRKTCQEKLIKENLSRKTYKGKLVKGKQFFYKGKLVKLIKENLSKESNFFYPL